jgi:protein-S-isoprenylcysteine O-methyltransferase Ste14
MSVYRAIAASLWIAWLAFWWLSSWRGKANRRTESAASRASHVIPLAISALLLVRPPLQLGVLPWRVLPATVPVNVTGTALIAAGLLFSVWARLHLGDNWSATVTVKQDHELVRTGPYRFVRHPIYTGVLLALIGTAVARGDVQGFVADVLAGAAFWRKLRLEERWMQETFGDAYRQYRAQAKALLPFVL